MNDKDLKKIGDEMVKVLDPVYKQLDRIENKQTALAGDMIQVQAESGIIKDKVTAIDEKLTEHIDRERKELNKVRTHVGMPPTD